jgi:hypothetical protein
MRSMQSPKNPKTAKDADQIKAFRKAARELGCDDNEERFKDALRTVAKAKPSSEKDNDKRAQRRARKTI